MSTGFAGRKRQHRGGMEVRWDGMELVDLDRDRDGDQGASQFEDQNSTG